MQGRSRTGYHPRHHRHKVLNFTLIILGLVISLALARSEWFSAYLLNLGRFGILGAFVGGALFVCTFTVTTGALILRILAKSLSPLEIGLFAAAGAVVSDLTIFRLVKSNLLTEVNDLTKYFGGRHLVHLLHTKYFQWSLPVIGAILMASPLPDEAGISLLGLSKMSTRRFVLIAFLLHAIGIFIVLSFYYL